MASARAKKKTTKTKVTPKSKSKKPAVKLKAAKRVAKKPAPKPKKKAVVAKKKPVAKKAAPKAKKPVAKKPALDPRVKSALEKADVEGLISRLPPPVQPIVKSLRALVLETAPEAQELLEDGAPSYFANGIFARIVPSERQVLVQFLKAAQLPSGSQLDGGALTLTDSTQLKESVLRQLVREAVLLNSTAATA